MPIQKKVIFCLLVLGVFCSSGFVRAQTNPQDQDTTLTLTIRDDTPPSIPVLISPTDNSVITDSTPSFVWKESTDNMLMGYYRLYLDGSVLFNNIPLTATSNGSYVLTKSGDEYTLTPVATIADGNHTWKVEAVDNNNNTRSSVTWSFRIDTAAPTLVITAIGDETTNISAQDLSTLPDPYLALEENEPLLVGTSEANSTIELTVIVPGDSDLNYTIAVDSSGNWSQQLPILPRDVIITLNFIVTDLAGNVTVLNDVYIMIESQFPFSTPLPTALPGEEPVPTATPVIPIPIVPPKEIATNIINTFVPEEFIDAIPQAIQDAAQDIAPVSTALISVGLPLAGTALIATQFGWGISLQILLRILQALGILPPPKPQGLVFNSDTEEPVAFAILNISNIDNRSMAETVVTNTDGVYGGVELPPGKYSIEVRHEQFIFPTIKSRPQYLTMYEFYKGELFEITQQSNKQLFLIPVDPKKSENGANKNRISWALIRERFIRIANYFIIPLFLLSLLIAVFYPSWINIGVCLIYIVILCFRLFKWLKIPNLRGKVVNDQGQPLENVFVRIFLQESNQLMAVLRTNKKGEFKASVPKNQYQVSLSKQGFIWVENGEVQNFYLADVTKKEAVVLAVMESAEKVFKDLF